MNVFAVTLGGGQRQLLYEPGFGEHVLISPASVVPAGSQTGELALPEIALIPLMTIGLLAPTWHICVV